jgi:hypothetical protein
MESVQAGCCCTAWCARFTGTWVWHCHCWPTHWDCVVLVVAAMPPVGPPHVLTRPLCTGLYDPTSPRLTWGSPAWDAAGCAAVVVMVDGFGRLLLAMLPPDCPALEWHICGILASNREQPVVAVCWSHGACLPRLLCLGVGGRGGRGGSRRAAMGGAQLLAGARDWYVHAGQRAVAHAGRAVSGMARGAGCAGVQYHSTMVSGRGV